MLGSSLTALDSRPLLPILRIPPGHDRAVELLSVDWVHLSTHWAKRSLLCPGAEVCGLCGFQSPRARWYLPAKELRSNRVGILEFSAQASAQLEQSCRFQLGTWSSGCQVLLSRRTSKSPLRSEPEGVAEKPRTLGLAEWFDPLMKIYDLPRLGAGETLEEYSARLQPMVLQRAELAARLQTPGFLA